MKNIKVFLDGKEIVRKLTPTKDNQPTNEDIMKLYEMFGLKQKQSHIDNEELELFQDLENRGM